MKQQINQIETTKVLADPLRPKTKATIVIVVSLIAAGALFAGTAAFGIYSRNQWTGTVQQRTNQAARLLVGVIRPEKSTGMISLQLPGQTTPYTDAAILAQTSGYLKKWYFDIGARVKAGDVLAEIDTPEVDQQLAQAQAQLKLAQAAFDLAEITYKRYQELFKTKVISAQDFDTATDNYSGANSTVIADQAQVGRLQALEDFKILRAPFDGIVTARNTDIGAYIPAGSGTQLFRMAATSRLRVYVTVPQALSSLIEVGEQAELTVDQFPGRKFSAQVIGTAGAINSDAKRLLTELVVPNPTGELSSGTYVQITLE
jgi:RND family efflux transporter MFP subunit